uniref:Uncharacterized protein n=1 Tax=Arundo donax TaxID=35708 RepID=A0A0A9A1H9_ARUDO
MLLWLQKRCFKWLLYSIIAVRGTFSSAEMSMDIIPIILQNLG